jgi:hypothetical protein
VARLTVPLSDIDVLSIGLIGDWREVVPPWLVDAARRALSANAALAIQTLEQRHQAGLLTSILQRAELWSLLSGEQRNRLTDVNALWDVLASVLRSYAAQISTLCSSIGIRHVFLKGLPAGLSCYDHARERPFHDIDILVLPQDATTLFSMLKRLGFQTMDCQINAEIDHDPAVATPGHYELPTLWKYAAVECDFDIASAIRATALTSRRFRGTEEGVDAAVRVEIHYAMTSHFNVGWTACRGPLIGDYSVPELDVNSQLLLAVYKAYEDLVIARKRKACKLFADGIRLISRRGPELNWDLILSIAKKHGIAAPVRYFVRHASAVFVQESLPPTIGDDLRRDKKHDEFDLGDWLPHLMNDNEGFEAEFSASA